MCKELIESKKQYLWRVEPTAAVGAHVPLTFNTQLVYMLDKENTNGINVFIVCLSLEKIKFEQPKVKYLTGLAFSIYVAAVDLDDDGDEIAERESEMDFKTFIPKNIASSASLQMLDNNGKGLTLSVLSFLYAVPSLQGVMVIKITTATEALAPCLIT